MLGAFVLSLNPNPNPTQSHLPIRIHHTEPDNSDCLWVSGLMVSSRRPYMDQACTRSMRPSSQSFAWFPSFQQERGEQLHFFGLDMMTSVSTDTASHVTSIARVSDAIGSSIPKWFTERATRQSQRKEPFSSDLGTWEKEEKEDRWDRTNTQTFD